MAGGSALVFSSGKRIGALALEHVRETMRPLPVEPVDSPLGFVEGIAIVRGEAVPVVNAEALLYAHSVSEQAASRAPVNRSPVGRFIRLRIAERSVALAVSEVLGVFSRAALDIAALPPLFEGSQAVGAVGRFDGRLLSVLEAASLVPDDAWIALAEQRSRR
jgi:chemotaxis signal transduction protein